MKRLLLILAMLIGFNSFGFASELPKNKLILILLDESGSMVARQSEASKDFNSLLRKLSKQGSNIVLARFGGEVYKYEYGTLSDGSPRIATGKEIKALTDYSPAGGTPLYDSTAKLVEDGIKAKGIFKQVEVFVFTDGEENESKLYNEVSLKELITKSGFVFNYISIKLDPNHNEAWLGGQKNGFNNFAVSTGGRAVSADVSGVFTSAFSFKDVKDGD